MIKIENLQLDFPSGFNLSLKKLDIEKGQIFTIIGPNGAGKTTLLNIMDLFLKPQKGKIEIFGQDLLKIENPLSYRRKISFVFSQSYLLNETVYKNVALPLALRNIHDSLKVEEMLELFQISELKNKQAATLSQGQRQRVSLARAFVSSPALVLLDEPFLSLDAEYKESLLNSLRNIIKLKNITTVFVTQDQTEALRIADKIAVMKEGRILQVGSPQEVFSAPNSKEVANFLGIETIVEGWVVRKEGSLTFIKVEDRIIEAVSGFNIGDSVLVCIRPEDVILMEEARTSSARNQFKGAIKNIYNGGLYNKVEVDCGFKITSSVTNQSLKDLGLKVGKDIFISFKATAVHLIKR